MQVYKRQSGKWRPFWKQRDESHSQTDRKNEPVESYLHQMQDEDDDARAAEEWIEAQEAFVYDFLCDELDVPKDERYVREIGGNNLVILPLQ